MVVSFFYYFGRTPSRTRHETLVKYYNKKEGKQKKKAFFNSSSKSAHDLRVRYLANSRSLNKNARMQEDSRERNSIEERNQVFWFL